MHLLFNADKLPEAIASNLQGYSWSFSHFFLWRALRLQLDCGEGAAKGLHADVQSVVAAARDAGVRNLVLFHMSRRYEDDASLDGVRSIIEQSGFRGPVVLIRGGYNLPTD